MSFASMIKFKSQKFETYKKYYNIQWNSLLNDFKNIQDRFDKWDYFKNIVWREFAIKYNLFDKIKFWRNQNKNEVDLIIEEKKAYEVKFNEKLIQESKYKLFREKYPQLNLEFITWKNFIEFMVTKI
jgi:predicted AAA+ superfamily ATPase